MADRTIKPDDTNDLVLQNNDGSAKIEVNEAQNIVLTGGSTTALTIDTDGDVNIANNIDSGTITSSVTFPAHHIIQTIFNTSNTTANGTGTTGVLAVTNTIDMASSSHKLLVMAVVAMRLTSAALMANAVGGTELKTSGSGVTAQTFHPSVTDAGGLSYGVGYTLYGGFGPGDMGIQLKVPINYLFSPAYEGTVTVTANGLGYSTNEGVCYTNVGGGGQTATSSLLLFEVVA
tara:strand:+ start:14 stop:709 length:696 start_codon:yes stop_codon:yes gene_type:complete